MLLLLLVFILGTVIASAISVGGAISNTNANLRRRMRPIVTIDFDTEGWWTYHGANINSNEPPQIEIPLFPPMTPHHVRDIGALPQINFYDYITQGILFSFDLETFEESVTTRGMPGMPHPIWMRGTSRQELAQIDQGAINLISGRQFEEGDLIPATGEAVAIISDEFANLNQLTLGSTFDLYN